VDTVTRPKSWWPDVASLAGFVAFTALLAAGHLLDLDTAVADWADAHRPAPLYWIARVLNYLGQGGQVLMPVSVLLAGLLAWRRRSVRPLLVFAGAFVLTYLTIGPLKVLFQRAAPASELPDRVVLFNSDAPPGEYLLGYPSGHVANALVWYGVIALLLAGLRGRLDPRVYAALRIVPPVVVFATTTYLSFHWITDSVAGLLLGLVLARLMARVPWDTLPLPHLRDGWERPAGLGQDTQEPARMTRLT
jgi:membrane-associated phospholipid phosphatase